MRTASLHTPCGCEQPHLEALARAAELGKQLLGEREGVVQQVERRKRGRGLCLASRLGRAHGALQLALLLVDAAAGARLVRAVLTAELLAQLRDGAARLLKLLLLRVLPVVRRVVRAEQKVQRRDPQLWVGAEEGGGDDVDGLGVAPDLPAVQLDHRAQRVLCAHRARLLQDVDDVVLQRAVERLVARLAVGGLDVGHDVGVQPRAQRLVAAAEQPEAPLQQRERRDHPAVPQQDERLQQRAPHGGLEDVVALLEEAAEPLGKVGHQRRKARRDVRDEAQQRQKVGRAAPRLLLDEREQRLEVAQPPADLLGVAIRVAPDEVLQRG
mmetsp:Transcript_31482/g.100669  ORF Transcript_31482/g.100669 Transcript_31482/m.100669 type:complete len:326 (-) Transcript_31482:54-1031(-)